MNLTKNLLSALHKFQPTQLKKIFDYDNGMNIDCDFVGFLDCYYWLSKTIPKDWTIVDLGCFAGLQSWYFRKHKRYIGVDTSEIPKFWLKNTSYWQMDIEEFINKTIGGGTLNNENQIFVICNYVPINSSLTLEIRKKFKNLYIYYPE